MRERGGGIAKMGRREQYRKIFPLGKKKEERRKREAMQHRERKGKDGRETEIQFSSENNG